MFTGIIASYLLPKVLQFLGKLTLKELFYIALVLAIVIGCAFIWWKGDQHGKAVIEQRIEKQDQKAKDNADRSGDAVDRCYATPGMRWDQPTGSCVSER